jgi:hypothetical protein
MNSAPILNSGNALRINLDVKEQNFEGNEKGIPIAGRYPYPRGGEGNAIGEYQIPPPSGTYVLGSVNGAIQWIATEACDE